MNTGLIFKDILFGVATGDALGVPFEFKSRKSLSIAPAVDMMGYGTHDVPPGTWSDDSSLTFCLAEALLGDFNPDLVAAYFIKWLREGFWTPRGKVFDIGITTRNAIYRLESGVRSELAGGIDESENGNGSIMRILPLIAFIVNRDINERFQIIKAVSSITHAHIRSVIACFYYLEYAGLLLKTKDKFNAYSIVQQIVPQFLQWKDIEEKEIDLFKRLLKSDISAIPEEKIQSSGYVLHTLEASMWCLLSTSNYKDAVLKAVNLGDDTDTTAAVTGGLAGILYGFDSIPKNWVERLARKNDIENLALRLERKYNYLYLQ